MSMFITILIITLQMLSNFVFVVGSIVVGIIQKSLSGDTVDLLLKILLFSSIPSVLFFVIYLPLMFITLYRVSEKWEKQYYEFSKFISSSIFNKNTKNIIFEIKKEGKYWMCEYKGKKVIFDKINPILCPVFFITAYFVRATRYASLRDASLRTLFRKNFLIHSKNLNVTLIFKDKLATIKKRIVKNSVSVYPFFEKILYGFYLSNARHYVVRVPFVLISNEEDYVNQVMLNKGPFDKKNR